MAASIRELLQAKQNQEKKEKNEKHNKSQFKAAINDLCKEMHGHIETIVNNRWEWQQCIENSNNRDTTSIESNEDMSTETTRMEIVKIPSSSHPMTQGGKYHIYQWTTYHTTIQWLSLALPPHLSLNQLPLVDILGKRDPLQMLPPVSQGNVGKEEWAGRRIVI